jgi:hypothetical protein
VLAQVIRRALHRKGRPEAVAIPLCTHPLTLISIGISISTDIDIDIDITNIQRVWKG